MTNPMDIKKVRDKAFERLVEEAELPSEFEENEAVIPFRVVMPILEEALAAQRDAIIAGMEDLRTRDLDGLAQDEHCADLYRFGAHTAHEIQIAWLKEARKELSNN